MLSQHRTIVPSVLNSHWLQYIPEAENCHYMWTPTASMRSSQNMLWASLMKQHVSHAHSYGCSDAYGIHWEKGRKAQSSTRDLLEMEPVILVIKREWDGLYMWNVQMMLIGSNIVWQWRGDVQERLGGMVSRTVRKVPIACYTDSWQMEKENEGAAG